MRRVVAALLYLYPKAFRKSFGPDMRATFDDRWRECPSFWLAARTVLDLISSAIIQRLSSNPPVAPPTKSGDSAMTNLWQDFRFALRTLRKSPAFTLVALTTLALAIGANTAMFSVANSVLWRSLPFADPERIVWVGDVARANPDSLWGATYLNFRDWHARSHSFQNLAVTMRFETILHQGAEPARVSGLAVSQEFFDVLGARPTQGRAFEIAENKKGAPLTIIVSEPFWRRHFGADNQPIGRTVRLDDDTYTVVGMMPESFKFGQSDYLVPLEPVIDSYFVTHRDVWVLTAIGRLKPGQSLAAAQTEMDGIASQIVRENPRTGRDLLTKVIPLQKQLTGDLRPALLTLLGAVAVVLLIACANLAGLMSVRAAARAREMAVRSALGAGLREMLRQLLTECMVLALVGGAAGVGLAFAAIRSLPWLTKDPRLLGITVDVPVLIFACAATIATSLLFGIAPAIYAARVDAADSLAHGQRTGGGRGHSLARQILVVAQVALCLVLLVGAGLLFRSFERVLQVNPGFRTDHLLSMRVGLPGTYTKVSAIVGVYAQFMERLRSMPGVTDATAINSMPISGGDSTGDLTIEGIASNPGDFGGASFRRTLPGYFQTLGIPLVRGRDFADSDDLKHDSVVVINESMSRRFWPNQDPTGHRIKIGPRDTAKWLTIVGVVKDVRYIGLDSEAGFSTYQPLAQQPRMQMQIAVRTAEDPALMSGSIQRELRQIEPALIIDKVETMSQRIDESVTPRRLNLVLFALFSGLALVLASIGLYGVVAYAAGRRTREFGIRMALGARQADVLLLVLGEGLKLAAIGAAIGIAAALGLGRLVTKLLFGIEPSDPATMAGVTILLACVVTAACWLPARKATRIAPTVALRVE